ncbi:MAG TPA: CBS domain-containing protein [Anaerolineae bacterium]
MTIGVPICRDTEPCGVAAARLARQSVPCEVIVALDDAGMATGWLTCELLSRYDPARIVGEVMDEDIPTVPPDIPAEAAAQMMRDRGTEYLFLMHVWPGESRPSGMVSLKAIERRLALEGA